MKAVRMHSLGGPRQLVYEEVEKPLLDPGDALIRVIATSITKDELSWPPTYKTKDRAAPPPHDSGPRIRGHR